MTGNILDSSRGYMIFRSCFRIPSRIGSGPDLYRGVASVSPVTELTSLRRPLLDFLNQMNSQRDFSEGNNFDETQFSHYPSDRGHQEQQHRQSPLYGNEGNELEPPFSGSSLQGYTYGTGSIQESGGQWAGNDMIPDFMASAHASTGNPGQRLSDSQPSHPDLLAGQFLGISGHQTYQASAGAWGSPTEQSNILNVTGSHHPYTLSNNAWDYTCPSGPYQSWSTPDSSCNTVNFRYSRSEPPGAGRPDLHSFENDLEHVGKLFGRGHIHRNQDLSPDHPALSPTRASQVGLPNQRHSVLGQITVLDTSRASHSRSKITLASTTRKSKPSHGKKARRTGPLNPETRNHAAWMRKARACNDCRKAKIKVRVTH